MEQLQYNPDLTSSSSRGKNKKKKKRGEKQGSSILRGRKALKNSNNNNNKKSVPGHHPSLPYTIHLFTSLPLSPWSCLHGNPLRASRPWVCACVSSVCVRVWAGKLVQATKLRAFFVYALPLVNLSQVLQGSSGREREGERVSV